MKEFRLTEKGFKVIDVNVAEILKMGGQCICDSCNEAVMPDGVFVGVLGRRTYCNECYAIWYAHATYYPEDANYELMVTRTALVILNS